MSKNKHFIEAFEALLKNAGERLHVEFIPSRDPLSREQKESPCVARVGSTVFWRVKETDALEDHANNLVRVEELMDEAIDIAAHEKKAEMEHPDVYRAMKARVFTKPLQY